MSTGGRGREREGGGREGGGGEATWLHDSVIVCCQMLNHAIDREDGVWTEHLAGLYRKR